MSVDLRNDPDWKTKAPFGLHIDGSPVTAQEYQALKNSRTETIHVKVDNDAITETMNENKRLKQEVEDAKEAKAQFDDMKEKAALQLTNLGIPTETINSKEEFDRAVLTIKKLSEKRPNSQGVPSGNVPLSVISESDKNSFGSFEDLVDHVRDLATSSPDKATKELNQKILDSLILKTLKGTKESQKEIVYEMPKDVSIGDYLNNKARRRRKIAKGI